MLVGSAKVLSQLYLLKDELAHEAQRGRHHGPGKLSKLIKIELAQDSQIPSPKTDLGRSQG
jgi:hypothetical protein